MKLSESLKAATPYPVPASVFNTVALVRDVDLTQDSTLANLSSKEFRLANADLYKWLFLVPNVTQEGISYSFTNEDKKRFRSEANAIYEDLGEPIINENKTTYGYKGNRL